MNNHELTKVKKNLMFTGFREKIIKQNRNYAQDC